MRSLAPALVSVIVCACCWWQACGTDVTEQSPGTSTSTGTGAGAGTGGGTTSTGGATPSGGGGAGGGCAGCGPCEAACYKLEVDCQSPITCAQIPYGLLDCANNPHADCYGGCLLAVDCDAIASVVTSTPDPGLAACLQNCGAGGGPPVTLCGNCLEDGCGPQIQACLNDNGCMAFLQCVLDANCQNIDCVVACDAQFHSTYSAEVITCTCDACGATCPGCPGGGGAGGLGGAGGAGAIGGAAGH
jgi:hypothetical protein